MNIVIDATWIADKKFTGRITGGALRVLIELLNGLGDFPEHSFYLTCNSYLPEEKLKLQKYRDENLNFDNIKISVVCFSWLKYPLILKVYKKLTSYFPISYFFSFITKEVLNNMDAYHSCNDALPRFIRKRSDISKFFTALDLIPIVHPEYSNQFFEYTHKLYSTLPSDVKILSISESTKKDILKFRKDLIETQIRVIYLGASKKYFYRIGQYQNFDINIENFGISNKKYFLTINAVAKYKNFEFILDGFLKFNSLNASGFKMVVIGLNREESYKEYLFTKYGNEKSIIFLENLLDEDLTLLYNGAKAFLYMSKYEGFGLPVLEAMQCGTPVICSNCASLPEIVGEAALMCDPDDMDTFVSSMNNIATDTDLVNKLTEAGLIQSSKFTWDIYRHSTINAYETM